MEITYLGGNCLKINAKKATIIVDDNLAELGLKSVTKPDDITFVTSPIVHSKNQGRLTFDMPGEFEVSDISVQGVGVRGSMDEAGTKNATIFKVTADDLSVAIAGHIFAEISDEEREELGHVDVLFVPVGGNGYTLDGEDALKLIKKIAPKIVVPTHYDDSSLKYEVPQAKLEDGLKGMAMETHETVQKLKLKVSDIPETTQLIVLERQ